MAIPDFQSVMLPILETLQDGKERTMRELTEQLALRFKLTEEERQEHLPSGPQSLFYNRVAWAKTHLTRPSRNQEGPGRTPRTLRDSRLFMQFRLMFTRRKRLS